MPKKVTWHYDERSSEWDVGEQDDGMDVNEKLQRAVAALYAYADRRNWDNDDEDEQARDMWAQPGNGYDLARAALQDIDWTPDDKWNDD